AESLEAMCRADTLVIDKTGTLTEGKPRLVHVEPAEGLTPQELLRLTAAVERNSEHPLGAAIVRAAVEQHLALPAVESFESLTGKGVVGRVERRQVVVGNAALMREKSV